MKMFVTQKYHSMMILNMNLKVNISKRDFYIYKRGCSFSFSVGITWFRERLLLLLNEMFVLDIRHVAATLLHPRYRSLKGMPDHIKNQCFKYVRQQVRQLRDKAAVVKSEQQSLEPPKKKFKNDKDLFSRFESQNFGEEANEANHSGS